MTPPREPNLFLPGPSKTATTSWYEALGQHPDVYMAPEKEPDWWDKDHTYTHPKTTSLEAYLAYFEGAGDEARVGEASPWYFHSEAAPKEIKSFCDDPRVIITIRNPVDRLHSFHSQRVHIGNESIKDFAKALAAEEDRKQGRRRPERTNPVEGLFYRELAPYTPHLKRWLATFDDDEILVFNFDRFVQDRPGTYKEACEFLGIDPSFEPSFERSNPNSRVRLEWVRDVLLRDPPWLIDKTSDLLPDKLRLQARQTIKRINTRYEERDPMPPELRAQLTEELVPDIEALEGLMGWDLSSWKEVPEPS